MRKMLLFSLLNFFLSQFLCTQTCTWMVTVATSPPSCPGEANGAAEVLINGLNGQLNQADYLWSTGWDMPTVDGLSAGNYSITVTDQNNNCVYVVPFHLSDPHVANYQISVIPANCGSDNGAIDVSVYSDEPWGVKWINTEEGMDLAPGQYDFYIAVENCYIYESVSVPEIPPVTLVPSYTDNIINYPGEVITINMALNGGAGPYTFNWWNVKTNQIVANTQNLQISHAGVYILEVIDTYGCEAISEEIHILDYTLPSPVPKAVDESFSIFPNPSHGNLNIPLTRGKNSITIHDAQGRLIEKSTQYFAADGYSQWKLEDVPDGVYIINIFNKSNGNNYTSKIRIQNYGH